MLPFARAFANPALTRSAISDLSNWATAPIIWNSISPAGARCRPLQLPIRSQYPVLCTVLAQQLGFSETEQNGQISKNHDNVDRGFSMRNPFWAGRRKIQPSAVWRPASPTAAVRYFVSIASVGVHQPQIDVPRIDSALHVGDVLPVGRPDGHANRDLRIVFEGDLTILLGFEIQYPEIAMASTVAQIYEFAISRARGRRLHRAGLVRDLDTTANVLFWAAVHRVAPNIELDLPTGRDDVAVPIQVRRDVRRLPESELTEILSSGLDRPQIHGSQVQNRVASGRAVDHSRAVGKPGKTR